VGAGAVGKKREALKAERRYRRELAEIEARTRKKKAAERKRTTAKERRAETDDEVRANIAAELVPVFDRVRRTIKATPRMTRTEAFLLWAERNPDQVLQAQGDVAELEARRLIAEQEKAEREIHAEARKAARRKAARPKKAKRSNGNGNGAPSGLNPTERKIYRAYKRAFEKAPRLHDNPHAEALEQVDYYRRRTSPSARAEFLQHARIVAERDPKTAAIKWPELEEVPF
jgi:hypothetical protein